jgi:hypothetical protein
VGNVGLLFVGAVQFLDWVMLLGRVEAKSAAPIDFFVGVLQVVTTAYLIFTANGDAERDSGGGRPVPVWVHVPVGRSELDVRSGRHRVGLLLRVRRGVCACLLRAQLHPLPGQRLRRDLALLGLPLGTVLPGVFLVLGLKRDGLTRYSGAACAIQGWVTGTIPAFLVLTGRYSENENIFGLLYPRLRAETQVPPSQPTASGVPAGSSS